MTTITDRALVPLKHSDFKVIVGERRLSDVRLAERLGLERLRDIRELIGRWESFLEQQSGKPPHHTAVSQGRGPAGDAYWLTIPELIFIAGQSRAKNAPVVQYEAALIAGHWIEGTSPPDDAAPMLRALTASDRPRLVPVNSEWHQPELFEPTDLATAQESDDELGKLTTEERHQWVINATGAQWGYADREPFQIEHEHLPYDCILRRDPAGDPWILWTGSARGVYSQESGKLWISHNDKRVFVRVSSGVPLEVVKLACERVGILTPTNAATIDEYFDE